MTLSSSLAVPPGQISARGLWVSVETLSLTVVTGEGGWPFPFCEMENSRWGHPVPPGGSRLKLLKNELIVCTA